MRSLAAPIAVLFFAACSPYLNAQNTPDKNAQVNETKGMPPRAAPADYQAHAQAGSITIAAEFMGHSVPRPEGPLSTDDYVVVETGLFGPPGSRVTLSPDNFSLRINGKKQPLSSQPFGFVLASLRDPDWSPPKPAEKPKTSFGGGGQDANAPPPVVHIPIELQRSMAQYVEKAALPEGDRPLPQAGLLFFPYRGKSKSIHSIELIYSGSAGKATLPLQP